MTQEHEGVVTRSASATSYCFVVPYNWGEEEDVLLHRKPAGAIFNRLENGDRIAFNIEPNRHRGSGWVAVDIEILHKANE